LKIETGIKAFKSGESRKMLILDECWAAGQSPVVEKHCTKINKDTAIKRQSLQDKVETGEPLIKFYDS